MTFYWLSAAVIEVGMAVLFDRLACRFRREGSPGRGDDMARAAAVSALAAGVFIIAAVAP